MIVQKRNSNMNLQVLAAKSRAEELEKENGELCGNLVKREQELDLKQQEREDLEANLARTKEKLETETQRHNETKLRLSEMETRTPGSVLPPLESALAPLLPPPPPPMAPPPPAPPGAPPPPPLLQAGGPNPSLPNTTEALRAAVKKCVPQPSNPLKSFNWSKLPECKVFAKLLLKQLQISNQSKITFYKDLRFRCKGQYGQNWTTQNSTSRSVLKIHYIDKEWKIPLLCLWKEVKKTLYWSEDDRNSDFCCSSTSLRWIASSPPTRRTA